MTLLIIQEELCWMCQQPGRKITMHHALAQHLNPKNNIIIPLCTVCHEKVNQSDVSSMLAYAYKLERLGTQVRNGASKLFKSVNEYIENDEKETKPLNKAK